MTTLVSLVGEDPVPILLCSRHFTPPRVVLVSAAGMESTERIADRLRHFVSGSEVQVLLVDPYNISGICARLVNAVRHDDGPIFNLTGGTTPMSIAAYEAARARNGRFVYMVTKGSGSDAQSVLYQYGFHENQPYRESTRLLPTISPGDFLRASLS